LASAISTLPPLESALKTRSASAASFTFTESVTPEKFAFPETLPSDAITTESPILSAACMTLFSEPGGIMPGGGVPGISFIRISAVTSAPTAFL
jgi:hypothetical protein